MTQENNAVPTDEQAALDAKRQELRMNKKQAIVSNLEVESEKPSESETEVLQATDENASPLTGEQPTDGTGGDDDDDADISATESDGRLGVEEVNKIVKARIKRSEEKTRKRIEQERQEEIEFWQERAKANKTSVDIFNLPPKPSLRDYASAPDQYEKDLEAWTSQKAQIDAYKSNINTNYVQRCNEFKKAAPDFDQVIGFFNNVTVPPAVEGAILQSNNGPQLAYHLAKNFKEFNRISKIADPLQVIYELAKIELTVTGQVKAAPITKPIPKPIKTIQGGSSGKPIKSVAELAAAGDKQAVLNARKAAHQQNGWSSGRN